MSKKAVMGIVNNRTQTESLVDQLTQAGFPYQDISVIFPNEESSRDFAVKNSTKAPEGAVTGASAGGLLGGTLGLLAGIGALAIPGLGPFIAAGPIMAALSGAAIGAAAGGITGALIGMGIPEYEAKIYEGKIKEGNILIAVHTENVQDIDRATKIFENAGATDISSVTESGVTKVGNWDNDTLHQRENTLERDDVNVVGTVPDDAELQRRQQNEVDVQRKPHTSGK